jgi:CheY-like chemotaxis protein
MHLHDADPFALFELLRQSGPDGSLPKNLDAAHSFYLGYEMAKANQPDLIIMDVEMPVMNGIEATTRIKADTATGHIPVLIFTSLGSEQDIRMAREAGGSGFLNKPISKEELRSTISSLLSPGRGVSR